MIELGIKPVFVFDGSKDTLKNETVEERRKRALDAEKKVNELLKSGESWSAQYKKSRAVSQRIKPYMIDDLKKLVAAFGFPVVNAEFEAESQLAYMVSRGDIFCSASQDYDCVVYGSPIVVRNLFSSKKKEKETGIEMIKFDEFIKHHEITKEQLVDISILAGNDFIDGVDGFGLRTAMKWIKEYSNIEKVIANNDKVRKGISIARMEQVRDLFLKPKINENYKIEFKKPDLEEIEYQLVVECNFDPTRVTRGLERLGKESPGKKQQFKRMF